MIMKNNSKLTSKRISDAYELFDDIDEIFKDEEQRCYLVTILTKDELDSLIGEFLICFTENEDAEKVSIVENWKEKIS